MKKTVLNKPVFFLLSFTWGIVMTLIGLAAAGVMLLLGYRPYRNVYGWAFEIPGTNFGGIDLGFICIVSENPGEYLLNHEFGHSVQNCFWGPLFPFVIAIPSMARYWYREFKQRSGKGNKTGYYDIWFEGNASNWGYTYFNHKKEKSMV